MNLIRTKRPKYFMQDMQDEMSKMMQDFMENFNFSEFSGNYNDIILKPAMELIEKDGVYEVKVQLPGIDKNDIDIEVSDNSLTIKAETKQRKDEKGETTYNSEFKYGKVFRTLQLPNEIDSLNASADYKNGILKINLPKTQEETKKVKKLEIKD